MSDLSGPALLFCPADRPDRYAKALAAADLVILDLEDAVAADGKQAAREALLATPVDPDRVIVRVNAVDTDDHARDLETLRATAYRRLMLPKTERAEDVQALAEWDVIALCETARGVLQAPTIAAAPNLVGMMWGAEDLIASMHGQSSRNATGEYRDVALHARSTVLLAACAYQIPAIDSVYLDIKDLDGLATETRDAVSSGFTLKACIHPSQVDTVRTVFAPSDVEVDWARRVLAAAEGRGVFTFEGRMIDAPLLRHAEQILTRRG